MRSEFETLFRAYISPFHVSRGCPWSQFGKSAHVNVMLTIYDPWIFGLRKGDFGMRPSENPGEQQRAWFIASELGRNVVLSTGLVGSFGNVLVAILSCAN